MESNATLLATGNGTPAPLPEEYHDEREQALGVDGPGILFDALGKTWSMVWITQGMKATFVAWMKKQARAAVYEMKGELSPEEYRDCLDRLTRAIAQGEYRWAGERWGEYLGMKDGKIETLSYGTFFLSALLLSEHHPDLHPLTTFSPKGQPLPADTEAVIRRVIEIVNDAPEAFGRAYSEALSAPKAKSRPRKAATA